MTVAWGGILLLGVVLLSVIGGIRFLHRRGVGNLPMVVLSVVVLAMFGSLFVVRSSTHRRVETVRSSSVNTVPEVWMSSHESDEAYQLTGLPQVTVKPEAKRLMLIWIAIPVLVGVVGLLAGTSARSLALAIGIGCFPLVFGVVWLLAETTVRTGPEHQIAVETPSVDQVIGVALPEPAPGTKFAAADLADGKFVETDKRPDWVTEKRPPGSNLVVLSSPPYATQMDAEVALMQAARNASRSWVHKHRRDIEIPDEVVSIMAAMEGVKKRSLEWSTVQVGEFSEPVCRLHWLVDLDQVASRVVADAIPAIRQSRTNHALGICAVVTGLLMGGYLGLRSLLSRHAPARA